LPENRVSIYGRACNGGGGEKEEMERQDAHGGKKLRFFGQYFQIGSFLVKKTEQTQKKQPAHRRGPDYATRRGAWVFCTARGVNRSVMARRIVEEALGG
jgi:hypothetical protein